MLTLFIECSYADSREMDFGMAYFLLNLMEYVILRKIWILREFEKYAGNSFACTYIDAG